MPLLEPGQGGGGWNIDAFGRNRNDPNYAQMVAQDDARRAAQVAGDQSREQAAQSEIQQLQSQGSTYWGGQPSPGSAFGAGAGGVPSPSSQNLGLGAPTGPAGGGPNFTYTMGMPGGQAGMTGRYLPELMPGGPQMPGGSASGASPYLQGGGASAGGQTPWGGFNPNLGGMADEITRRSNLARDQGNNAIRSNAVGVGGLGGSRQGVAEGINNAMSNDSLQGNLTSLFGTDWTNQQNRNLTNQGQQMGFYTQQRGQDQTGAALGANLFQQGQQGMWGPLNNANGVYGNYTGLGNTTQTQNSGGGVSGMLGGALGGSIIAKNLFGNNGNSSNSSSWW